MDDRKLKFYGWRRVQDIEQWERVGCWQYGYSDVEPCNRGYIECDPHLAMNRPYEWWRPVRHDETPFSDEIYAPPKPAESTMEYERRVTRLFVAPVGEPIGSDEGTTIFIDDEAAGEFLIVEQDGNQIRIDRDEWPHIREAVEEMLKGIRG